jgi:glycosyltransferase involved in cell wall biosynthesis
MQRYFYCIGISVNQVLQEQIKDCFEFKQINFSKKGDFTGAIRILLFSLGIKKSSILIYNTSIFNLLLLFILKFRRNKVLFHLHDPIPHSGILNPIIFIVNFLLVLLSDDVSVFSQKLNDQVNQYYFTNKCHIVKHGMVKFNYSKQFFDDKKIVVGFFGRNMPYKNYDKFLNFIESRPDLSFLTVGQGYPSVSYKNHELISGVVDKNTYYSLMFDVDYVFFSHSQISYSGVLSDLSSLNKTVIFDELNYSKIRYNRKHISTNKNLIKQTNSVKFTKIGWDEFRRDVLQIIEKKL